MAHKYLFFFISSVNLFLFVNVIGIVLFSILNNPSSIQPFIVIENENISAIFSPRNHIKIFTMGLVNIGNNNKDE